jgi:perosamine synthetase
MYEDCSKDLFPVAVDISSRGINLPSYPDLSDEDVRFIAGQVVNFMKENG